VSDFHDVKLVVWFSAFASPALYNSTSSEQLFEETVAHAAEGIQR